MVSKERKKATVMKKAALPVAKTLPIPNRRDSKPTPASKTMSSSQSSIKKENGSSLPKSKTPLAGEIKKPSPRSKIPSVGERKKVAPTSLHMSLSLGPWHSDSAATATERKSLIMEKMGDKDIVRRAFKTFQNSNNQSKPPSSEVRSSMPKQVSLSIIFGLLNYLLPFPHYVLVNELSNFGLSIFGVSVLDPLGRCLQRAQNQGFPLLLLHKIRKGTVFDCSILLCLLAVVFYAFHSCSMTLFHLYV